MFPTNMDFLFRPAINEVAKVHKVTKDKKSITDCVIHMHAAAYLKNSNKHEVKKGEATPNKRCRTGQILYANNKLSQRACTSASR
jgi:hypothetical protein